MAGSVTGDGRAPELFRIRAVSRMAEKSVNDCSCFPRGDPCEEVRTGQGPRTAIAPGGNGVIRWGVTDLKKVDPLAEGLLPVRNVDTISGSM